MTRGVLALVHGDVVGSVLLNPGVLLALLVVAYVVWRRPRVALPMWLPFAVIAALWSFQLLKYATGRPL